MHSGNVPSSSRPPHLGIHINLGRSIELLYIFSTLHDMLHDRWEGVESYSIIARDGRRTFGGVPTFENKISHGIRGEWNRRDLHIDAHQGVLSRLQTRAYESKMDRSPTFLLLRRMS